MKKDDDTPFSYPVKVGHISANPVEVTISADAAERAGLAKLWSILEVKALTATFEVRRWKRDGVRLKGRVSADIVQACVVTLDPFPVQIDVPVQLDFAPEEEIAAFARRNERDDAEIDIEVLLNEEDPPEPIVDGVIDLGGITLEFLALALDPYPRKPGASFESSAGDTGAESPFAALAKLKRGD